MSKILRIAHIASEVDPFSKTGGLADVARSLPKAIKRLGHEVIVITPLHGKVIDKKGHGLKIIFDNVKIDLGEGESVQVNFWKGYLMEDLPVYFIENTRYFSRYKKLYGSSHENVRFMIFDLAALKLLSLLHFNPDIIHCHDWQTGLIPYFIKFDSQLAKSFKKSKTIFTIHNLIFQLGHNWWEIPVEKRDYGRRPLPSSLNPEIENINFAKRGILNADIVNTVSEQYRTEIMTKKFGQDLHRILRQRQNRLFGIINGIDYNAYNPGNDSEIHKLYNFKKVSAKNENKKFLQHKFGLTVDERIPMFCATSRVTFQKGFTLILKIIDKLLRQDVQFIFMGDGDKQYIKDLKKVAKKHPKKLVWIPFNKNKKYETSLYAGADFFLLPSNHEPCGINQLIAMRYGCIPIVREVGGLYDTVSNFNPATNTGTGFTFKADDEFAFFEAIIRALENYKHRDTWRPLVSKVMQISNSWEIPAKKYVKLYRKALNIKNGVKRAA